MPISQKQNSDASSNDPNTPLKPQLTWNQWSENQNTNLHLATPISSFNGLDSDECDFWDKIGYDRLDTFRTKLNELALKVRARNNKN